MPNPEYRFGGFDLSRMYPAMNLSNSPTIYSKMVASVNGLGNPVYPHHPLNCSEVSTWDLNEVTFSCKHASVSTMDEKTQGAIVFSIAELLMEIAREKF